MKLGEKGFTLLEVVIAVAIMAVIIGPLAMATTTLLTNPERSNDKNVVLQQVRNAGDWISRDVQMAKEVTADAPGFLLTLIIPVDADENKDYSIKYLFAGSKLTRQLYDSSENLTAETLIADYIDTDNTIFVTEDDTAGLYKLTVRAARGEAVVTRSYEVSQRLSSD